MYIYVGKRQNTIKELGEKDLEFVEALRNLKVPRIVATLITYLANTDEATSGEIEIGANLRKQK